MKKLEITKVLTKKKIFLGPKEYQKIILEAGNQTKQAPLWKTSSIKQLELIIVQGVKKIKLYKASKSSLNIPTYSCDKFFN